jgi:hypothetical protein
MHASPGSRCLIGSVAIVALVTAGCNGSSTRPSGHTTAPGVTPTTSPSPSSPTVRRNSLPHTVAALGNRPLRLPRLKPGQACPVTTRWAEPPTRRFTTTYGDRPILGPGPVFPLGPWPYPRAEAVIGHPTRHRHHRTSVKILWAAQHYRGPILIRGRRLDRQHRAMLFQGGTSPGTHRTLWLPSRPYPLAMPSQTIVTGLGCYGWQVDGTSFTEVIVFRALPTKRRAGIHVPTRRGAQITVRFQGIRWTLTEPLTQDQWVNWFADGGIMVRASSTTATFFSISGRTFTFARHPR